MSDSYNKEEFIKHIEKTKPHLIARFIRSKKVEAPEESELMKLKKDELLEICKKSGIEVEDKDTKAILVEKIEKNEKA